MISFPEILHCKNNNLLFKKVDQNDSLYIWETAPLDKLFLVIGCDASDHNELADLMQLDWTTWYLMFDNVGYSYGLIRAIPEMDNSISLHGIGWTQHKNSPRTFVFSWYAFHFWLFSKQHNYIKTYCDFNNINAIHFDLKTGYVYDYWMPTITLDKKILHLKIEKNNFLDLLQRKQISFSLKELHFSAFEIPNYQTGKANTSKSKHLEIEITELESTSELDKFITKHKRDHFYYYCYMLPKPLVYSILFKDINLGYLVNSVIKGKQSMVVFISTEIDLCTSLEIISKIKNKFELKTLDLIMLGSSEPNESLINALSIKFQFAGNHSSPTAKIWVA